MAGLLSALRGRVDGEDNARIGELLDAVEEDISELRQPPVPSNPDTDVDRSREPQGMSDASPVEPREPLEPLDAGSMDLLDEDLLKDDRVRATGFVGKNSELQWLRTIMLQLERGDESPNVSDRRGSSYGVENIEQVSTFNFYLNSESVDLDYVIDPYELPTPETAERLLQCYMATVHDSFPILPRKKFEEDFRKYFRAVRVGTAPRLSPKWQAIMNLVFAIGAKHSHLVKARWEADEVDHLIYQARARAFGLNEFALINHPDVHQIQVFGLLAFYYLSVGQISRSWIVVGVALRFAYSLGLHVRNEDPSASTTKKEMLVRIWWSIYSLERLLSIITGRPSIIVDSACSVPFPAPISEDQLSELGEESIRLGNSPVTPASIWTASSSVLSPTFPGPYSNDMVDLFPTPSSTVPLVTANCGSYFKAVAEMGIITQNVLTSLYSAATMIRSPGDIQRDMCELGNRLDQWVVSLPSEFNFQTHDPRPGPNPSTAFSRESLLLGFHFCSARILLTRPCLFSLSQSQLGTEPNIPTLFIRRMADVCVNAAKTATDFLPDQPNPVLIYKAGPWWSIVHNMMQAISVFLLALSYSVPGSQEVVELSQYAKKMVRWLRMMKDPLAENAYSMAFKTLVAVARRVSLNVSDLVMENSMVFPNSDQRAIQVDPYGIGGERLPNDVHTTASIFTSFDPMSAPTFQQQNNGPPFDSPYFRNN